MAKVNHHFVPRFYLKMFGADPDMAIRDQKRINLYNISADKEVRGASLADQCYKKRFYGETDEIENALAGMEGVFARVIKNIAETGDLPAYRTEDHAMLLVFIASQMTRTLRMAKIHNEYVDIISKSLLKVEAELSNDPDLKELAHHIDELKIGYTDPVMLSMKIGFESADLLGDLKMVLVKADDGATFITSDDPVCLYNAYCEGVKEAGVTGFASRGLQVFVPISPSMCIMLYDGTVYKVGDARHNITIVNAGRQDVDRINGLQVATCDRNIYFSGDVEDGYIVGLVNRFLRAREGQEFRAVEFEGVNNPNSVLTMFYRPMPNIRLDLSFISIRREARKIPLGKRVNVFRPVAAALAREMRDQPPDQMPQTPQSFVRRMNRR